MNEAVVTSIPKEKTKVKVKVYFGIKRLFDICISLIGMIFLIPCIIFVKIAYMLTGDFHTIFYSKKFYLLFFV